MILVDFGIICIGQYEKKIPKLPGRFRFEYYIRKRKSPAMYNDSYHFETADKLTGSWYFVWFPRDIIYEKSFFDLSGKHRPWIYVLPEWEETVRQILEFYLEQSPEHRIAVLVREQDRSENISHADCTLDEYMNALRTENIRWNELYFIRG